MGHAGERLASEGGRRLGAVQAARPAAEGGGIGYSIGVLERGRRLLPRAVLHKASPERLAPSQQAVVGVRERKWRKEGEGLAATGAATAPDPNPIVMFIVRLLAAASMAEDRIAFTHGTSPQDNLAGLSGPIGLELVRWDGKWDKENRGSSGLCPGVDLPRSEPEAEPLLLKRKNPNWRRITLLSYGF